MTGNPIFRAHSYRFSSGRDHALRAGNNWHAVLFHGGASLFFFTHQSDHIRSRSDELDMTGPADFGEVGVFRKQAVAGMDGVDVGDLRRADHGRNIEITLRQLRRADADGFIGKTYVQRIPVGLTVDCDRANAQFLACANDAQAQSRRDSLPEFS